MAGSGEAAAHALFAWGANSYGQLGLGHKEDVFLPTSLQQFLCNQTNIKSIAGGGGHSVVLTAEELFSNSGNGNPYKSVEDILESEMLRQHIQCPTACKWWGSTYDRLQSVQYRACLLSGIQGTARLALRQLSQGHFSGVAWLVSLNGAIFCEELHPVLRDGLSSAWYPVTEFKY
ncbi:Secretion-regulating guanine nucleotide exchange factor [Varanus komodoensis]|nr:Secretion-regulating guanine nucleotide exchange factor [Varanus komodoensis]